MCSPNTYSEPSQNPTSPACWVRHPLQVLPVPCCSDHPGVVTVLPRLGFRRAGAVSQAPGVPVLSTGLGRDDTVSRGVLDGGSWTLPAWASLVPDCCVTLGQALPLPGPQFPHCSKLHLVWSPCANYFPAEGLVRGVGCCPNPDRHTPLPQIIAFDELRTDFKNPIDQGNPARAVSDTCAVPRCVRPSVFPFVQG